MSLAAVTRRTELQEIADGLYAYLQPDGGWCLNNAGILVGTERTAVIDTAATASRARRLRAAVDEVSPRAAGLVVNTHFHGDHTYGNYVFAPEATVLAHADTRTDMAEAGLHMQGLWPDVAWGEITVTLPGITIRERTTLHLGGIQAELLTFPPAHTRSDVAVWLPESGVLFTGDLVMAGVTPFVVMGSVSGSLAAIAQVRALGARTVVTGHGPVAGPRVLDEAERYFHWLQELAGAGLAAGLSPLELAREADLGPYAELLDSERLVGNLHRAYAEANGAAPGAALDVNAVFGDIIALHGRVPACHA